MGLVDKGELNWDVSVMNSYADRREDVLVESATIAVVLSVDCEAVSSTAVLSLGVNLPNESRPCFLFVNCAIVSFTVNPEYPKSDALCLCSLFRVLSCAVYPVPCVLVF